MYAIRSYYDQAKAEGKNRVVFAEDPGEIDLHGCCED